VQCAEPLSGLPARSACSRLHTAPPSNGPEQSFQFIQAGGLLLPALNAYLHCQIAEPMKQKKRHEPPAQPRIRARLRISVPPLKTANTARHSPRRERARTEEIVLTPTGHDVTKIDERRQPPMPGVFLKEEIFWIVLPCQNDRN